jgi:hypothetical protein
VITRHTIMTQPITGNWGYLRAVVLPRDGGPGRA